MAVTSIPQYHELMWPVLNALRELGGSATVKEMCERVVEDEHFSGSSGMNVGERAGMTREFLV